MPSLNRGSILQTRVLLFQYLPFQNASTVYSWYLLTKSTNVVIVLAACETSYARGLKKMQLAADYSLHNQ